MITIMITIMIMIMIMIITMMMMMMMVMMVMMMMTMITMMTVMVIMKGSKKVLEPGHISIRSPLTHWLMWSAHEPKTSTLSHAYHPKDSSLSL